MDKVLIAQVNMMSTLISQLNDLQEDFGDAGLSSANNDRLANLRQLMAQLNIIMSKTILESDFK